jgi:lipoate-protein ligase A
MNDMTTLWRLIDTGPLDGPTNMAIDEALLKNFDPQHSEPVLRLYGWTPPALSLGRFQNADEVLDLQRCTERHVPVVRRITGGGVIYHAEELTYSIVCAPHHIPEAQSVKESFRVLTSFLIGFYRSLSLDVVYAVEHSADSGHLGLRTAFCFAGKESYDILIAGRKIGGNAQRRLKNAIFQHGSIPLRNMASEGVAFLRQPPEGLEAAIAALADLGVTRDEGNLKSLLLQNFRDACGDFVSRELTPDEKRSAELLLADRYSTEQWNLMAGSE